MANVKRILMNKNVVTIVLLLVGLVILYFGYDYTIKKETSPVSVPVTTRTINPTEKITDSDIKWVTVPQAAVGKNVIRNNGLLVGNYANINVTIPEGSMFYTEWVITKDELPGKWIELVKKGEVPYYFPVSITTTLGNSILPDTYIDIYLKIVNDSGTVMFGKMLENIKVLAVHDSEGKNVFAEASNIGTPSYIGFGVTSDLYLLLKKATYLNLEFIISPRGQTPPTHDYIVVKSETLQEYINSKTVMVPEDEILKETEDKIDENGAVIPEKDTEKNTNNNNTNNNQTTNNQQNASTPQTNVNSNG